MAPRAACVLPSIRCSSPQRSRQVAVCKAGSRVPLTRRGLEAKPSVLEASHCSVKSSGLARPVPAARKTPWRACGVLPRLVLVEPSRIQQLLALASHRLRVGGVSAGHLFRRPSGKHPAHPLSRWPPAVTSCDEGSPPPQSAPASPRWCSSWGLHAVPGLLFRGSFFGGTSCLPAVVDGRLKSASPGKLPVQLPIEPCATRPSSVGAQWHFPSSLEPLSLLKPLTRKGRLHVLLRIMKQRAWVEVRGLVSLRRDRRPHACPPST